MNTNAAQKDGALYGAEPFEAMADRPRPRSARSGARLDAYASMAVPSASRIQSCASRRAAAGGMLAWKIPS